jgi:hypothetical protein
MGCMQIHGPHLGLSVGCANGRRFDAMIDRVAYQMNKRIDEAFDHAGIHLSVLSGNGQRDVFPGRLCHFTNRAAKTSERGPYRDHTRARDLIPHA